MPGDEGKSAMKTMKSVKKTRAPPSGWDEKEKMKLWTARIHKIWNLVVHADGSTEVIDGQGLLKRLKDGQQVSWQRATSQRDDRKKRKPAMKKK